MFNWSEVHFFGSTFYEIYILGGFAKRSNNSESQPDSGFKSESSESVYFIETLDQSYDLTFILAGSVYAIVSFSSCQRNLIKTFQVEAIIALITEMAMIFS